MHLEHKYSGADVVVQPNRRRPRQLALEHLALVAFEAAPSGVCTSQTTRAVDKSISQGMTMKVSRSGLRYMSLSATRGKPSTVLPVQPHPVRDGVFPNSQQGL